MVSSHKDQTITRTTTIRPDNVIQVTDDYSIFKFLPHNRPVVQSHVARLAQSMSDRPHLRPARPVLVNDGYEVVDGQHRLKASEMNGQSVYFMVVPKLTIEDARLLNALQRTWSLLDYAYSYASSGVQAYVQFIKTYEARELPPSTIMEFMCGSAAKRRYEFRVGELAPVPQHDLNQLLDHVEEIVDAFPTTARTYVLTRALKTVMSIEKYDHERMIKKISETVVTPQSDRIAYVREMERIYNADIMFNGPNYLRFF